MNMLWIYALNKRTEISISTLEEPSLLVQRKLGGLPDVRKC